MAEPNDLSQAAPPPVSADPAAISALTEGTGRASVDETIAGFDQRYIHQLIQELSQAGVVIPSDIMSMLNRSTEGLSALDLKRLVNDISIQIEKLEGFDQANEKVVEETKEVKQTEEENGKLKAEVDEAARLSAAADEETRIYYAKKEEAEKEAAEKAKAEAEADYQEQQAEQDYAEMQAFSGGGQESGYGGYGGGGGNNFQSQAAFLMMLDSGLIVDQNGAVVGSNTELPAGSVVAADGTIITPDGATIASNGATVAADGTVVPVGGTAVAATTSPDAKAADGTAVTADAKTPAAGATPADGTTPATTTPTQSGVSVDGNGATPAAVGQAVEPVAKTMTGPAAPGQAAAVASAVGAGMSGIGGMGGLAAASTLFAGVPGFFNNDRLDSLLKTEMVVANGWGVKDMQAASGADYNNLDNGLNGRTAPKGLGQQQMAV